MSNNIGQSLSGIFSSLLTSDTKESYLHKIANKADKAEQMVETTCQEHTNQKAIVKGDRSSTPKLQKDKKVLGKNALNELEPLDSVELFGGVINKRLMSGDVMIQTSEPINEIVISPNLSLCNSNKFKNPTIVTELQELFFSNPFTSTPTQPIDQNSSNQAKIMTQKSSKSKTPKASHNKTKPEPPPRNLHPSSQDQPQLPTIQTPTPNPNPSNPQPHDPSEPFPRHDPQTGLTTAIDGGHQPHTHARQSLLQSMAAYNDIVNDGRPFALLYRPRVDGHAPCHSDSYDSDCGGQTCENRGNDEKVDRKWSLGKMPWRVEKTHAPEQEVVLKDNPLAKVVNPLMYTRMILTTTELRRRHEIYNSVQSKQRIFGSINSRDQHQDRHIKIKVVCNSHQMIDQYTSESLIASIIRRFIDTHHVDYSYNFEDSYIVYCQEIQKEVPLALKLSDIIQSYNITHNHLTFSIQLKRRPSCLLQASHDSRHQSHTALLHKASVSYAITPSVSALSSMPVSSLQHFRGIRLSNRYGSVTIASTIDLTSTDLSRCIVIDRYLADIRLDVACTVKLTVKHRHACDVVDTIKSMPGVDKCKYDGKSVIFSYDSRQV